MGEMRSGTTWLGEILTKMLDARLIFEPLNYEFTDYKQLGKGLLYADENTNNAVLLKIYNKILSGNLPLNYFVDKNNLPGNKKYRVIKSLRMSWSIPYINKNFSEISIIYILRHPMGSLASQVKVAKNHKEQLSISKWYYGELLNHPILKKKLWQIYGELKINSNDYRIYKLGSLLAHYRIILDTYKENKFLIVFYEDLVLEPKRSLLEISDYLENKMELSDINLDVLKKPSKTTKKSEIESIQHETVHKKWQRDFDQNFMQQYEKMLKHFELNNFYDEKGLPNRSFLKQI
ncbi:sulfotransferase domain-containing protein [Haloflavibacter putidus]|nr:sulfotransferase domain-containing protein [Haloflavibacter putidus]